MQITTSEPPLTMQWIDVPDARGSHLEARWVLTEATTAAAAVPAAAAAHAA